MLRSCGARHERTRRRTNVSESVGDHSTRDHYGPDPPSHFFRRSAAHPGRLCRPPNGMDERTPSRLQHPERRGIGDPVVDRNASLSGRLRGTRRSLDHHQPVGAGQAALCLNLWVCKELIRKIAPRCCCWWLSADSSSFMAWERSACWGPTNPATRKWRAKCWSAPIG